MAATSLLTYPLFSPEAEAFEKLRKVTFLHVFVCVKWVFSTRMEGEVIGAGPYRATKLVRDVLVTFRRQLITDL